MSSFQDDAKKQGLPELQGLSNKKVKQLLMLAKNQATSVERYVPPKDKPCHCGRQLYPIPHCPACGSSNIYALEKAAEYFKDGDKVMRSPGWKCRRCHLTFSYLTPCEAPPDEKLKSARKARMEDAALSELRERMHRGELTLGEYLRQVNPNAEQEFNRGKK
jgi:hypothetical protein